MNDVQMFWSLYRECVEFLSQVRSEAVLMQSRHGEGQTDEQGLYQNEFRVKSVLFNLLCLWSFFFSERLQSALFQTSLCFSACARKVGKFECEIIRCITHIRARTHTHTHTTHTHLHTHIYITDTHTHVTHT